MGHDLYLPAHVVNTKGWCFCANVCFHFWCGQFHRSLLLQLWIVHTHNTYLEEEPIFFASSNSPPIFSIHYFPYLDTKERNHRAPNPYSSASESGVFFPAQSWPRWTRINPEVWGRTRIYPEVNMRLDQNKPGSTENSQRVASWESFISTAFRYVYVCQEASLCWYLIVTNTCSTLQK